MAEGTNSNVSDDDSDTPSFEDLLDLIHEQQRSIGVIITYIAIHIFGHVARVER